MTARRDARMATLFGANFREDRAMTTRVTGAAYVEPAQAPDRGLGRLIEEAERLLHTIATSHKKAVRELPILPLRAAVARAKEME